MGNARVWFLAGPPGDERDELRRRVPGVGPRRTGGGNPMDSTSKCNGVAEYDFGRGEETKALARPVVEVGGNGLQVVVGDSPQVRVPGKIAADEAIGVFDCAFLPGVIGVAEEEGNGQL